MSSFDVLPELALALDRLVPEHQVAPDWNGVLTRAGVERRRRIAPLKLAFYIAAIFMLVAGIASATYLLLHHSSTKHPRPGALTVAAGGYNAKWPVEIIEPQPSGKVVVVWRCPGHTSCGEPAGLAWSPDGRHVAFTLKAFNIKSAYLGLHIIDLRTGRDVHPRLPGCEPAGVAWSPDGRTLAYDCGAWSHRTSRIHLIAADGSKNHVLPGVGPGATAPTWAPGGTRIAFSRRGAIYTIGPAGGAPRLLARDGSAPAWSPDGDLIAYRAPTAVRLVTPAGETVRTALGRLAVGPAGVPAWSPDGRRLAISADGGALLYLVDADGRHLHRLTINAPVGSLDQPAWYPVARKSRAPAAAPGCGLC